MKLAMINGRRESYDYLSKSEFWPDDAGINLQENQSLLYLGQGLPVGSLIIKSPRHFWRVITKPKTKAETYDALRTKRR